mmetsp:Transcript_82943/g.238366  ORF Transcript_82943/g.238366 Transcript_82943/m.238366 type:complete len:243 (-) Transcript_82943:164-892(-)
MGAKESVPEQQAQNAGGSGSSGMLSGKAKQPTNQVQFVVSQIGGAGPMTAYHSSVVVNGEEFSFSDGGISAMSGMASHKNPQMPNNVPQVFEMGMSHYTGSALKSTLERYFVSGSYDLLRKNCNSFSDIAVFYLLHKRIDAKYRAMEKLGASMQSVVASASEYKPNPKAEGFDVEAICKAIDPEKVWATPGQATGGVAASSAEEMRAARLARLSGGGGAGGGAAAVVAAPSAAPAASSSDAL